MTWTAGADGCPLGWFRVCHCSETGSFRFHALTSARELCSVAPFPAVLAVDIPIGLTDAGRRECDCAARAVLGWPRRNSVFPAPIRPALSAKTRLEAAAITQRADGRRVGAQAWAIYGKIRQMDAWLRSSKRDRSRVREVHPEVSFWAMRGGRAFQEGKKSRKGGAARRAAIERCLGAGVFERARAGYRKKDVADDDILDALAALWTAERIERGVAKTLPEHPARDSRGLPMEIVY